LTAQLWMKQRREQLGMSQSEFATLLSRQGLTIKKSAVSKWETGHTPLPLQTPENRRIIAGALQISIQELLILAGYEIETLFSHEARMVAIVFDQLLEAEKEAVIGMMDYFVDKRGLREPNIIDIDEAAGA
jgi:transcriptional regulator with XRE-family HTH domain